MYKDILNSSKKLKNMTQKEIVKECEKLGAKITCSYLNKILNKDKVPDEKISRALAKVLNIDEELLILEGYLQNAPDFLKIYIDESSKKLLLLGSGMYEKVDESLKINNKKLEKAIEKYLNNGLRAHTLLEMLKFNDFNIVEDNISKMGIKLEKDKLIMNLDNVGMIDVEDDAMQPVIPKSSKIKLSWPKKYEDGDIVYINANGKNKIRGIIWLGQDLFLYTYDRKYNCEIVKKGDYMIIGKASSCTFNL